MKKINPERVLVRSINKDWFVESSTKFYVNFNLKVRPSEETYYVGLYQSAPVSAITHIGIVNKSGFYETDYAIEACFKAIIQLDKPYKPDSPVISIQYYNLSDFGLDADKMSIIRESLLETN